MSQTHMLNCIKLITWQGRLQGPESGPTISVWINYFTSLCLCFLVWKIRLRVYSSWSFWTIKWDCWCKGVLWLVTPNKHSIHSFIPICSSISQTLTYIKKPNQELIREDCYVSRANSSVWSEHHVSNRKDIDAITGLIGKMYTESCLTLVWRWD